MAVIGSALTEVSKANIEVIKEVPKVEELRMIYLLQI